jgi:hypothetical protein
MSAARWYLWIWGSLLIALGTGSLVVNPDFGVGAHVSDDRLFGVFETNGWHGVVGGLAGVAAVFSAWTQRWIREVAIGVAALAGIVAAAIFVVSGDGSAALGLIPVDSADTLTLHLLPGLVGLACVAVDMRAGTR